MTSDSGVLQWSFGQRYAAARSRLSGAQKSTAAVPAYLRYVNRRLGGYLACVAYGLGFTATQVSALSFLCSVAALAVLVIAPATVPVGIIVAVGLALGYALDSADGQLARVRGGGTRAGEWLDHVLDIAKLCLVHTSVAVTLFRHFELRHFALLLVPMTFLLAQVVGFFGKMLRDQLRARSGAPAEPPSTHTSALSALILLPVDHGTMCWIFVLLGWHALFVTAYVLLALVSVAFAARGVARDYRNLSEIDAATAG